MVLKIPKDRIDEGTAPFNMAIATLKRLDEILVQITIATCDPSLTLRERQPIKISLVKQFFLSCVPLLSTEVIKKYKKRIQDLRPSIISIKIDNIRSEPRIIFNYNLENELDDILIDLQTELQKEGYFMPSKDDPKFSWKAD